MKNSERRKFMQIMGTGALVAGLPSSISKALAIPAHHRTGTIADVEHIVILTQENQSFDRYFGTLRGVRGSPIHVPSSCRMVVRSGFNRMCLTHMGWALMNYRLFG